MSCYIFHQFPFDAHDPLIRKTLQGFRKFEIMFALARSGRRSRTRSRFCSVGWSWSGFVESAPAGVDLSWRLPGNINLGRAAGFDDRSKARGFNVKQLHFADASLCEARRQIFICDFPYNLRTAPILILAPSESYVDSEPKKTARGLRQRGSDYRCCIPALAGFVSPQSIAPDGAETSREAGLRAIGFSAGTSAFAVAGVLTPSMAAAPRAEAPGCRI